MADYTYDITTDIGKVRRLVSDNDSNDYLLKDNEIEFALDLASSDYYLAAAECCRMIAAHFAQCAPKINIEGQSFVVDRTQTPGYWMKLADGFEARTNSKPFSDSQEITDEDRDLQDALTNKAEFRYHDVPSDED